MMRRFSLCLLLALGALQALAQSPFAERIADRSILPVLQKGGVVLYMRHGATDGSRPDRAPRVDLNDCTTQRVLTDEGRKVAVDVGRALARARVPVREVYHSPMCRARESAELAFPALRSKLHQELDLMYTANLTSEEKKPVVARTRQLLSQPVAPGSVRVVVAHAPNLADLMGYFIEPEGTVAVFRPLGNEQFEYLASIPPALWVQLIR